MFIRIGSDFVNVDQIAEIRFHPEEAAKPNATVVTKDGKVQQAYLLETEIDDLSSTIIPAPPGYDAHRQFELTFDDDGLNPTIWTPVVAFAIERGEYQLDPITAEDGRLRKYAVRSPTGRIYTSQEEFFDCTEDYERDFAKRSKGAVNVCSSTKG
jgi:hypothetical protein